MRTSVRLWCLATGNPLGSRPFKVQPTFLRLPTLSFRGLQLVGGGL